MTSQESLNTDGPGLQDSASDRSPLQLPLFGLPTLCCACHRLKSANGRWSKRKIDQQSFPRTPFSHGICPACYRAHYPASYARRTRAGLRVPRTSVRSASAASSLLLF